MATAIPSLSMLGGSFGQLGNSGSTSATAAKPIIPNLSVATPSPLPKAAPQLAPSMFSAPGANSGSTTTFATPTIPNLATPAKKIQAGIGTPLTSPMNTSTASPTVYPPVTSNIQTGTDGSTINAATGGATPPASTGTPTPTTPPSALSSPLFTSPEYEAAVKAYQTAQQMTPEELANQTAMNNLQDSFKTAYTNTEGQPIPLEFITGQQRQLENRALNLEAPLDRQAALLQARRTATIDATKFGVQNATDKLSALRDYQKPVSVTYGSSLMAPQVNPDGTISATNLGGSSISDPATQKLLSDAITNGQLTPDMMTRYGIQGVISTLQKDPGYNFITGQAGKNFTTNVDTQKFIANSNTALNTINDPTQGIKALSNNVNRGNIVIGNNGLLALKAGVSDEATATFIQQANILADEVSKLLGSGQGSDFAIQLGQTLVNPNYSQATFNATMDNLAGRINNKVKEYKTQGAQGVQTPSSPTTSGGSGSSGSMMFGSFNG